MDDDHQVKESRTANNICTVFLQAESIDGYVPDKLSEYSHQHSIFLLLCSAMYCSIVLDKLYYAY